MMDKLLAFLKPYFRPGLERRRALMTIFGVAGSVALLLQCGAMARTAMPTAPMKMSASDF